MKIFCNYGVPRTNINHFIGAESKTLLSVISWDNDHINLLINNQCTHIHHLAPQTVPRITLEMAPKQHHFTTNKLRWKKDTNDRRVERGKTFGWVASLVRKNCVQHAKTLVGAFSTQGATFTVVEITPKCWFERTIKHTFMKPQVRDGGN